MTDPQLVLDSAAEAIYGLDLEGRCTFCNPSFLQQFRFDPDTDLLGSSMHDLIHHSKADGTPLPVEECHIYRAGHVGQGVHVDDEVLWRADGTSFPAEYWSYPVRSGEAVVGIVVTIIDRTQRERARRATEQQFLALERINQVSVTLAGESDLEHVVQLLTEVGTELSGAAFGAFLYNEQGPDGKRYMVSAIAGARAREFEELTLPRATPLFAPTFSGDAVVRLDDVTEHEQFGQWAPHHGLPPGHPPVRSYIAVPVVSQSGEVIGGLLFGHEEPGRFDQYTEVILSGLAAQAAVAVDNTRLHQSLQRELAERRTAEDNLRAAERRFRVMADTVPNLLFTIDGSGRLDYVNQRFSDLTGLPLESSLGYGWLEVVHPSDRAPVRVDWEKSARTRQPLEARLRLRSRTGEYRWFLARVRPVEGSDESSWFGAASDIHALVLAEERLLVANREAEAANSSKDEFLANVSHEIRSPITTVLGYADMLLGRLADADDRQAAQIIRRNGEHLVELIDDILDLSRAEAGRMRLTRRRCSVPKLLGDVRAITAKRARDKGLALKFDFDGPIPAHILTDRTRLRQILLNLVGNAIKFTRTGEVRVATTARNEGRELAFTVSDTGPGLAPHELERIFKPFTQGDNTASRAHGGAGLGLAISWRLARLLGGELTAESEPGEGSRFIASIATGPLSKVTWIEASEVNLRTDEGNGPRSVQKLDATILVVDDRPDIRLLIQQILEASGARVRTANHGQHAVDRVAEVDAMGAAFDAIVIDMQMPVMDGYAATAAIRRQGFDGPIVALTAAAMKADEERCLAAGCDAYVTKPIDSAHLVGVISELLRSGATATARRTAPKPRGDSSEPGVDASEPSVDGSELRVDASEPGVDASRPSVDASEPTTSDTGSAAEERQVLLVDDDDDSRHALSLLLSARGFSVQEAPDAETALTMVRSLGPMAVVTDLSLPGMDGLSLGESIARRPGMRLIALTGYRDEARRARARKIGFDAYLVKPVSLDELVASLDPTSGCA